jgi:hypothetical protein
MHLKKHFSEISKLIILIFCAKIFLVFCVKKCKEIKTFNNQIMGNDPFDNGESLDLLKTN